MYRCAPLTIHLSPRDSRVRDAACDITAFADFPSEHRQKIWSTNPLVIWSPAGPVHHVRHKSFVVRSCVVDLAICRRPEGR
jgi:hypothetical protein